MPQEREPPGASEPKGREKDLIDPTSAASAPRTSTDGAPGSTRAERPVGVWAAVVAMLVVVLVAVFTTRCDRQLAAKAGDSPEFVTHVGESQTAPDLGEPIELRGKVLRELPVDDAGGEGSEGSEGSEGGEEGEEPPANAKPRPTGDAELDAMLAELEPWTLEPPLPGSCRVRAWQGGDLVGPEVECEADGSYALLLAPGTTGTVHVEMLIEGHLRGLIELEIGAQAEPLSLDTVALGPGSRVAGQTVDARGEPLAKVRVQALPQPNLGEVVPWRTTSDEQGRFEFTTLPYGPINLRGIKSGYALSVVEAIAPEDAVLMVLDELIDLEGEVIGDPELLARAIVRLEGSSVWPAIERKLGEDGGFVFEHLPDGVYGVEVTVPPASPGAQEYASVPLENVTPDLHVALGLVPAFRVPVRVVDPEGEPVLGARVTLGYSQLGMLQKIAETDEEGRARVGPVVPGPYFVQADADGFLPPEPVEVEVTPEGFVGDEQVLVLIRPAKLEGIVVDEDDRPVAGAEVWLDSEVAFTVGEESSRRQLFAVAIGASEGSLGVTRGEVPDIPLFAEDESAGSIGSVMTDEDGRFEIDLLLPGTHRIWATHGGHAASAVESFELRSGELHGGLRLRLREGVPLTGVVRSANGQPIAAVQVDLGDGLILTTDERGVFDAGHRRGRQTLILRGAGLIPKRVEVDLGRGKGPGVDLELELEPAIGRFEGRVVDGNDQPIANVEIELRPLDGLSPSQITWTDERGIYQFDQLTPGPAELVFEHGDYVPDEARVRVDEAGGLRHELTLDTGWSALVLVRSAVRGDPIVGAKLRAGEGQMAVVQTDEQGQARLERLVGEAVEIEIEAPGWVSPGVVVRKAEGGAEVDVTVELVEGGSISGTIDDDIGDPVSNAIIEVRSLAGAVLGQTRSDGRGEWRVDGIRAGDVVVSAEPPPALSAVLAPVSVESDVLRGEVTTAVRLRFEKL